MQRHMRWLQSLSFLLHLRFRSQLQQLLLHLSKTLSIARFRQLLLDLQAVAFFLRDIDCRLQLLNSEALLIFRLAQLLMLT